MPIIRRVLVIVKTAGLGLSKLLQAHALHFSVQLDLNSASDGIYAYCPKD